MSGWQDFSDKTAGDPPHPLLVKAILLVDKKDYALDLGSGSLNDSKCLLEAGFLNVVAVDQEPIAQSIADQLPKNRFIYNISTFDQFHFPKERFNLINAHFSLPFNPPNTFHSVIEGISFSLLKSGIFVGQFFGHADTWNTPKTTMTFHTREEILKMFEHFEILIFEEKEFDGTTVSGEKKHWHLFHVIAKKI